MADLPAQERVITRPRILTADDIALVMELITTGIDGKFIAEGFSVHEKTIRRAILYGKRAGYSNPPTPVRSKIRDDYVNRRAQSILDHDSRKLSTDGKNLREAVA